MTQDVNLIPSFLNHLSDNDNTRGFLSYVEEGGLSILVREEKAIQF